MGKFSISSLVIIIWAIGLLALQTGCGVTLKRDHSPSATANNSDPGFSSSGDDSSDDSQGGDSSDDSSDGGDSNGGDDSGDGSGDGSDTVPADDETSGPIGGTGDDGSDDTSGGDDDGSGDGTGDPFPNSGILDIAFSDDGIFKYNQDQIDTASAVAVDSQDRILIIGTETFQTSPTALSTEIIATRLYPDGSPDNTFNSNVFITLNNISSSLVGHTVINDVLIQPNGKIVLVGMTNYDAMVLRLNENGTLDVGPNIETFGTSASSLFYGVAYQPDENAILAAGRAGGYHTIARFRGSDFQKDTTFGCGAGESYPNCDGVVRVSLNPQSGGGSYPFFDIAYEPDSQSIIAVGEVSASNIVTTMAHYQTDFAVARFDRHGNEQNYHLYGFTMISDTLHVVDPVMNLDESRNTAFDVKIDSQGNIFVAGTTARNVWYDTLISIHKFQVIGSQLHLVPEFGSGGYISHVANDLMPDVIDETTLSDDQFYWFRVGLVDISLRSDGAITMGGAIQPDFFSNGGVHPYEDERPGNWFLVNFLPNGDLDLNYGPEDKGYVTTDLENYFGAPQPPGYYTDEVGGLARDSQGRLIQVGRFVSQHNDPASWDQESDIVCTVRHP